MTSTYLQWCASGKQTREPEADRGDDPTIWTLQLTVVDVFSIIPCSPITPTVVITIRALELYCVSYYHNPHFSIQAYMKTLCDLHGMIDKVLHCDSPNWHLKHCCPACTYTLKGEQLLQFSILYALDGHDSLKHIQCKLLSEDGEGQSTPVELPTCQFVDQYASQDSVSLVWNEVCICAMSNYLADLDLQESEVNPCAGHWKNMDDQKTKKMWGVYDETGIMLAVYMVQSSELTKYPLAIISKLLEGLGLEDLKTCECTFSKSNVLASTIQYASAFHQKQSILGYFKHNNDYEVYANLSKFLYNNYKQALDTIHECEIMLPGLMKEQNTSNKQVFDKWLAEEKAYPEQLNHEPPEEMLQMEYWEQLIKLTASKKLNIDICWKPEDAEWQCMGRLVTNREYQQALGCLEGLVVTQIFELSKMNRAGTAAHAMNLPKHQLHWDEVVKYTFLSKFDLLRDLQQDISWQPWTMPAACLMMDWYFKKCCVLEEVQHLNIEIHCFITSIQDEDLYLCRCEEQLRTTNTLLAHQISICHNIHSHFNTLHLKYLYNISQLPRFTGTLAPGVSALKAIRDNELEEEEAIEENVVQAGCALQDVIHLTMDIEHTSGEVDFHSTI
ncbi:hypothetical protein EDC04DRAFT_2865357 [Pisolithus marmoratus]|nr:hypothetical protein EDC04DRAFT_2865357 [Pisolithus marmoratus]